MEPQQCAEEEPHYESSEMMRQLNVNGSSKMMKQLNMNESSEMMR